MDGTRGRTWGGNRTSCETDLPEAIRSLPYYHERIIKTSLKNEECQTLECLYTGNTLYLRRENVETKDLLKKNGYFYQEYTWYPYKTRGLSMNSDNENSM